ncbi:MAG: peptidoglycan-binding protein [Patescibacteria group bacterium]|nr:peptidoglycan-binding protein [Patescibacteria group bacterium]
MRTTFFYNGIVLLALSASLFVAAPFAQASTQDLGTRIVCRVFSDSNRIGAPLPALSSDGCGQTPPPPPPPSPPPAGGDGNSGGSTPPPSGGTGDTPPPAGGGGESGSGDTGGTTANTNNSTGGGGGGGTISGPLSPGFVNGLVLGTSTADTLDASSTCGAYLTDYLRMGRKNNPNQVKKLQAFLNQNISANLPVTGYFGPMTLAAVKQFQTKEWQEVLSPWVSYGLPSDHSATGYVYKTTLHRINSIMCETLAAPAPALP